MEEQAGKSNATAIIVTIIVILLLVIGFAFYNSSKNSSSNGVDIESTDIIETEEQAEIPADEDAQPVEEIVTTTPAS